LKPKSDSFFRIYSVDWNSANAPTVCIHVFYISTWRLSRFGKHTMWFPM